MESSDTLEASERRALGRAIRELRRQAAMTQAELGARMGINATYISRVEGGRINLRWSTLNRFLRALEATLADFAVEVER